MQRIGFTGLTLLLFLLAGGWAQRKPLDDYFQRPEPAYRWEKREVKRAEGVTIYTLFMISQTWQGIEWDHFVQVFYPDKPRFPRFAGLYNTGGRPDAEDEAMGIHLARATSAPFVILYGIPKQPLYGGLVEDALIVYTWQKFIETGDTTWPLHFPMAKAVLKCMDAVQAFLRSERLPVVERFMVTGASKRGWTAWLVGASQDPRVAGIAPMVIDVLDLAKQVPHHLAFYKGRPSEQIGDYVAGGMLQLINTPIGQRLIELEDPYSYRDRYTMPKLIINGTNDRYWAQDALNLYWDGLPEPKWILYAPNSGHGLDDRSRVFATLAAFIHFLARGRSFPKLEWTLNETPQGLEIRVRSTPAAREARMWFASTPDYDLRESRWGSMPMTPTRDGWQGFLQRPRRGRATAYAELVFDLDGRLFTLTTQLKVLEATPQP